MKNILILLSALLVSVNLWAQDADCSSYLAEITDGPAACADQPYLLQVPLDVCPGTISVCVDLTSDFFASEASIDILDVNGNVVLTLLAQGGTADGDQPGNLCTGDLPAQNGPYSVAVGDSFGDGNDGTILITDINNAANPLYTTTMTGDDGDGTTNPFITFDLTPAVINPLTTVTVNWYENGAIIQTDANVACNNFFRSYSLTTANICQTEDQTIGYEITCDLDNSTLASNLAIPVTVYPPVAPAIGDLVTITYADDPAGGCAAPTITYLNDCTATEVMVVEDTAPTACNQGDTNTAGNGQFTVTYVGPAGGPDCCATGGPEVPVNDNGSNNDAGTVTDDPVVNNNGAQSQFNGNESNNAVGFDYTTPTPGCGLATTATLTFNACNFVHPPGSLLTNEPNPPTATPPNATESDYFVTVYVNGAIVFDGNLGGTGGFDAWTLCQDLVIDLTAFGFDGNSTVEVYLYPNQLGGGVTYGVDWTADVSVGIDATYEICTESSPVNCALPLTVAYDCACAALACPTATTPASGTPSICTGGAVAATDITVPVVDDPDGTAGNVIYVTDEVTAGDPTTGTAFELGTTAPTATGCDPATVTVNAYIECDNDGVVGVDSYVAAGSFTVTVYPAFDMTLLDVTTGDCNTAPSVTSTCANYMIMLDGDADDITAAPASGESGTNNYTITYTGDPGGCFGNATATATYDCPAVCEITGMTAGNPVCAADGASYSVTVSVTGMDASVTLGDAASNEGTGVAASGMVVFTYATGTAYNITVTDSEGLCAFGPFAGASPTCNTPGCTDPCAPNYDAAADTDDGSCMAYDNTCNADCTAGPFGGTWNTMTCTCDGETAPVSGCTDPGADNYDAAANCDDGSCMTTTPLIAVIDPCNCANGIDLDSDPANGLELAEEIITVTSGVGPYSVTVTDGGLVDATGTPLAAGALTFTGNVLNAYIMADGASTYSITIEDAGTGLTEVISGGPCAPCPVNIPTVGEWGLIILALMMSITAIVGIRARREEEAEAIA